MKLIIIPVQPHDFNNVARLENFTNLEKNVKNFFHSFVHVTSKRNIQSIIIIIVVVMSNITKESRSERMCARMTLEGCQKIFSNGIFHVAKKKGM